MKTIKVGNLEVGNDKPFVLIAGLNVLEDDDTIKNVIEAVSYTHLTLPTIYSV